MTQLPCVAVVLLLTRSASSFHSGSTCCRDHTGTEGCDQAAGGSGGSSGCDSYYNSLNLRYCQYGSGGFCEDHPEEVCEEDATLPWPMYEIKYDIK